MSKLKKEFKDYCINISRNVVNDVRVILSRKYDINSLNSENFHYKGLCDEACILIEERLEKEFKNQDIFVSVNMVHGEQKHLPRIQSKYWALQHTWLEVTFIKLLQEKSDILGIKLYLDATSEQFCDLYDDIPMHYVSTKPPKWFYKDKYNPIFHPSFTRIINNHIKVNVTSMFDNKKHRIDIIEFLQIEIWGKISQFLYEIK